ncbi:hypothetical protein Moror_9570 [Moniliophthora roreri MCA 2997]|uniref:Uncharacterized protein n=1 Tax=Moniliophthora roreri (strain MCA 2997) TaxID=1381753 RepID=V2XF43_MONRO|nr:hypothetical protein Moror_9570 [Moniliophthora roreri MCA 2997]
MPLPLPGGETLWQRKRHFAESLQNHPVVATTNSGWKSLSWKVVESGAEVWLSTSCDCHAIYSEYRE